MMGEMDEMDELMSKLGKEVERKWGVQSDERVEKKVKLRIVGRGLGMKEVGGMENVVKEG